MTEVFSEVERQRLAVAVDALVPGAADLGAVAYVERLLGAFDHEPPRIWAAPGARSSAGATGDWLELGPWERQAWRERIAAWRTVYDRVLADQPSPGDERILHAHAIEATYGDPAYGGNRDGGGWQRIDFPEPLFPPVRKP